MTTIAKFPCPKCKYNLTKTLCTRATNNEGLQRTRLCVRCQNRFYTYEVIDHSFPLLNLTLNTDANLAK